MHSKKIRTDAKILKKRNIGLTGEVRERDARAIVESAWLMAITEKLASLMSKLSAIFVNGADFSWSTHSISNGASKVENNVSKALMAVSREATDATIWKVSIGGLKLENVLNRVSTQIKMELQLSISRIHAELERDDSEKLCNV